MIRSSVTSRKRVDLRDVGDNKAREDAYIQAFRSRIMGSPAMQKMVTPKAWAALVDYWHECWEVNKFQLAKMKEAGIKIMDPVLGIDPRGHRRLRVHSFAWAIG